MSSGRVKLVICYYEFEACYIYIVVSMMSLKLVMDIVVRKEVGLVGFKGV